MQNNELIELLIKLDNTLDFEALNIKEKQSNINQYSSTFFSASIIDCDSLNKEQHNCPGIYIFIISTKKSIPVDNFNDTPYAPQLNASNHKKLNIDVNSDFIDGQVLYLGKTEESLFDRLTEHINGDDSKRTYSLKLSDKNRESLKSKIKILVFKLNEDYEKYAKTVLSSIESRLHDELLPRVGSKR